MLRWMSRTDRSVVLRIQTLNALLFSPSNWISELDRFLRSGTTRCVQCQISDALTCWTLTIAPHSFWDCRLLHKRSFSSPSLLVERSARSSLAISLLSCLYRHMRELIVLLAFKARTS